MKGRPIKERGEPNGRFPNVRRLSDRQITEFMEYIDKLMYTPPDQRAQLKPVRL